MVGWAVEGFRESIVGFIKKIVNFQIKPLITLLKTPKTSTEKCFKKPLNKEEINETVRKEVK